MLHFSMVPDERIIAVQRNGNKATLSYSDNWFKDRKVISELASSYH